MDVRFEALAGHCTCGERCGGAYRVPGDERGQDWVWKTSDQGCTRIVRCMRPAAGAACICKAPALAWLTAAGGTYESATTRRFFKGRTEVIRVVTSESDAFVQAMLAKDGADDAVVEKRRALFERAAKVHVANAQAAGRGEGVDRHLLGERTAAGNFLPLLLTCCVA